VSQITRHSLLGSRWLLSWWRRRTPSSTVGTVGTFGNFWGVPLLSKLCARCPSALPSYRLVGTLWSGGQVWGQGTGTGYACAEPVNKNETVGC